MHNWNKPRFVVAIAHKGGHTYYAVLDLETGETTPRIYATRSEADAEVATMNAADAVLA